MKLLEDIIEKISKLTIEKNLVLIGIDGRGGSGKTTVALLIKQQFPSSAIVTTDDFLNEDMHKIDESLLEEHILKPLSEGKSARYLEFDGKKRNSRTVDPRGIIIIEGIYSTHSLIHKYYDLTIWVNGEDVDKRVIKRDGFYDKDWELYHRPNEDKYIVEDRPQDNADYILKNIDDINLNNLDALWKKTIG